MAEITLKELLEAGAHFGHQTSRWNPKMRRFILTAKNGIHLINLKETLNCVDVAAKKLSEVVESGRYVLFVGTKPQAKDVVRETAEACKQFYIDTRWLGGMLTNFATIQRSLKKVDDIDRMESDGTFNSLPKKECNILRKKREKILNVLKGVREMKVLPGALVIADIIKEHIALDEAYRLGIPVVGIIDTNSDPSKVSFPIPANDDSLKTISIILKDLGRVIAATPVKVIMHVSAPGESIEGKKRVVKRTVIKKIVKKKRLKSTGETLPADEPASGGTAAPDVETEAVE
jgi:small subunit ribosomal protein S2